MAYTTTITEVGPEAMTFLAEDMALTFGANAPEALRPFCFIIEHAELTGDLTVGQRVLIGEQAWTLTAVGAVASKNLADLGHVTMVFDGADTPRLPGAIHLAGVEETPALGHGVRLVFGDE